MKKPSSDLPKSSIDYWRDPVEDTKKLAQSIVGYSILVRKSEQSINPESLMWVLVMIAVFGGFIWRVQARIERGEQKAALRATVIASGGNMYDIGGLADLAVGPTRTPTLTVAESAMQAIAATMEALYTPTPQATITPTVTFTSTAIYTVNFVFKYSYYNPKLGGANCAVWDYALGDCVSKMANGEDWHDQYGKVVACPPEIALGTVVEVTYPDALKGLWTCKDRGGAIVGNYIDFLDILQRYDWNGVVSATLYPPTVPLEQVSAGSH